MACDWMTGRKKSHSDSTLLSVTKRDHCRYRLENENVDENYVVMQKNEFFLILLIT